ncbi:LexA family transcriptional regulator [Nitratidesulfovibrio vulgaris]|uniref:LexA family transcriptional regulator n=1 Tax=Nitratidesulfovibrio vulgaris TaxID=881 RepID=UPI002301502E|nr:S24 family peptidase [Nitratidesulfovibrio vulgaris]WCB45300.1 S24 family peptidase [Nitratidesulfovibrio vulgaris]
MGTNFDRFYARVMQATDIATQQALAAALGVNRSAVTQAKNRDAIPQKWILQLARAYHLAPDWLEFGKGRQHQPPTSLHDPETVLVPRVKAVLSAGGGSLDVSGGVVENLPFRYDWLARRGHPAHMVLMNVTGDSMEPGIRHGDTLLIDQSHVTAQTGGVYALGYEDSILVKRFGRDADAILLLSDNTAYAPIRIRGDEADLLHVIGKIVWLCRAVQ